MNIKSHMDKKSVLIGIVSLLVGLMLGVGLAAVMAHSIREHRGWDGYERGHNDMMRMRGDRDDDSGEMDNVNTPVDLSTSPAPMSDASTTPMAATNTSASTSVNIKLK